MTTTSLSSRKDSQSFGPENEVVARTGLEQVLGSSDHKPVGRMWILTGAIFIVVSLAMTTIASIEAIDLSSRTLLASTARYVQIGSLARELLILGGLVPVLIGIGLYLVPLQVGAAGVAFARGASAAFWTWLVGVGLVVVSYAVDGGAGGQSTDFVELWILSVGIIVVAVMWALVCIATTVLALRAKGMTLAKVPPTTWAYLLFSVTGLLILPVVVGELALTYIRLQAGFLTLADTQSLADLIRGVQSAPVVYWLAIPLLGFLVDTVTSASAQKFKQSAAAYTLISLFAFGTISVAIVGFGTVREPELPNRVYENTFFVSMMILAPLAVVALLGLLSPKLRALSTASSGGGSAAKIIAPATGAVLLATTALAILGVVEPITVGFGELGIGSFDTSQTLRVNRTTFDDAVRAGVFGAVLMSIALALNHWAHKIWGRYLNQTLSTLASFAFGAGAFVWALGDAVKGIADVPAFPATDDGGASAAPIFGVMVVAGVVIMLVGAVVVAVQILRVTLAGVPETPVMSRWSGTSLEWLTASPPVLGNFEIPPAVGYDGRIVNEDLKEESEEG